MTNGEVTTNEIMEFLQDHMVMREEFGHVAGKVDGLEQKVDNLEQKVDGLSIKINQTKLDLLDAMDDKLANLKGDLVILLRNEDKKLSTLVEVLMTKNILSFEEAQSILAMHPFPQMSRL